MRTCNRVASRSTYRKHLRAQTLLRIAVASDGGVESLSQKFSVEIIFRKTQKSTFVSRKVLLKRDGGQAG